MAKTSASNLNELLRILAAAKVLETGDLMATAMFRSADEMLNMIKALPFGDLPWSTFHIKYTGPVTPNTPLWKLQTYVVYTWNPLHLAEQMAHSTDFRDTWDYVPYEEYTSENSWRYCNLMLGRWAFKQAVSHRLPSTNSSTTRCFSPCI